MVARSSKRNRHVLDHVIANPAIAVDALHVLHAGFRSMMAPFQRCPPAVVISTTLEDAFPLTSRSSLGRKNVVGRARVDFVDDCCRCRCEIVHVRLSCRRSKRWC